MHAFGSLVIFLAVFSNGLSLDLPEFIKPCKVPDEELNACIKKHGEMAIPWILKGDKTFNIANLVPYKIPEVKIQTKNLDMKYKNIVLVGMEHAFIDHVDASVKEKRMSVSVGFENISITADYEIKGKILVFNLDGTGIANLGAIRPVYTFGFDFDVIDKEDGKYMKLKNPKLSAKVEKTTYHLTNLLGGNQQFEDEINKSLNENWKVVQEEIGPGIRQVIYRTIEKTFRNLFENVKYEQVFL